MPEQKPKKTRVGVKPSECDSGADQPLIPVVTPDKGLRGFLEAEGYVFDGDWPTLKIKIVLAVEALHGLGHAELFARNLGGGKTRRDNMRTNIVDLLARFMESEREANLLMSVHGEEVLAGYSEVLRVLKESGDVGTVVELGGWMGTFGRYLLETELAKAYVGEETADLVVDPVDPRRSPETFRLRSPSGRDQKADQVDWLVCTSGLHRRSDYFFYEDEELTPLPIEYQHEGVVAQAKNYYAGFFASVASAASSNTRMVITQPVRDFAEMWGLACAASGAGWSFDRKLCRCVWGGRRFATLVLQRGSAASPMTLSDAASWWGALVAPFSTGMSPLSDVALGEYFALENRVPRHSGQVGRSAIEVGFCQDGAYAIHSASPGGFTLFTGASERDVHSELRVYCDEAHGEKLPDEPWPAQGVVPSASGLVIAATEPSEQPKAVLHLSKKDALKAQREDLQRRVNQARVLDLDRLRNLGAVFPPDLKDSVLRRLDESALLNVDEAELRRCVTQTLKALAPELYKEILIAEIVAARTIDLRVMDPGRLQSLHAAKFSAPSAREKRKLAKKPKRKLFVRDLTIWDEAALRMWSVAKVEKLHGKESEPLSCSELVKIFVNDVWYIDAKIFLAECAQLFGAALASSPSRGTNIKRFLDRLLKEEKTKLAEAVATTSDPELLYEQKAVVEDLSDLLIGAQDSTKRSGAGIQGFFKAISIRKHLNKVENLHSCYDALHRLVDGARTGVEDWEKKIPNLFALGMSKKLQEVRSSVRVSGFDSEGKVKGDGRGVHLLERIQLPQSGDHASAFHVVQERLLSECGRAFDVATIRRLLRETPSPLDWLPEFLLWRTWRRTVERGRSTTYKMRTAFDQGASSLGASDEVIQAVRQFFLHCEFGFIHMLDRYPDRTPIRHDV